MSDPVEAKGKLRDLASDLDRLSKQLGRVSRELRPVQVEYDNFIRDHEAGLYAACESGGQKLPGKEMRLTLALSEMPASFRGKHQNLVMERDSLKQQLSNLKAEVDAWRSVLSADKVEMEAVGA